jgi:hypothetical protein
MTNVMLPWIDLVSDLRQKCPDEFKSCIVSSIGRFAMSMYGYQLVPERLDEHDERVSDLNLEQEGDCYGYEYWVHKTYNSRYDGQPQWYAYCCMQTARELFWQAYPWRQRMKLLATDYDAFYVEGIIDDPNTVLADTLAARMASTGTWKRTHHTHGEFPRARKFESDQTREKARRKAETREKKAA